MLEETSATKIRRLFSHELGDKKPSIFLQRLRNLAASQVTDEILKSIFMEQLPENVRTILAISEVQDLAKLAAQADKVVEMARPASAAIQAVAGRQADADSKILQEIAELRKQVKKLAVRDRYRRCSGSRGRSRSRRQATVNVHITVTTAKVTPQLITAFITTDSAKRLNAHNLAHSISRRRWKTKPAVASTGGRRRGD